MAVDPYTATIGSYYPIEDPVTHAAYHAGTYSATTTDASIAFIGLGSDSILVVDPQAPGTVDVTLRRTADGAETTRTVTVVAPEAQPAPEWQLGTGIAH